MDPTRSGSRRSVIDFFFCFFFLHEIRVAVFVYSVAACRALGEGGGVGEAEGIDLLARGHCARPTVFVVVLCYCFLQSQG